MKTLFGNLPSTNCAICGRKLTDPESVQRGIGPVCASRNNGGGDGFGELPDRDICDFTLFDPIERGIILRRDEYGVHTNVPHLVAHHSPTGYEFGYGGSGPADLALNLCEVILRKLGYSGPTMECWDGRRCFELAYALHQDFKWQFIASAPREGIVIPFEMALEWVVERIEGGPR